MLDPLPVPCSTVANESVEVHVLYIRAIDAHMRDKQALTEILRIRMPSREIFGKFFYLVYRLTMPTGAAASVSHSKVV